MRAVFETTLVFLFGLTLGLLLGLKLPDYSPHPRPCKCDCRGAKCAAP